MARFPRGPVKSVDYDPYSRAFQHDPYPLYRVLRDQQPCTYNPQMDFYALFRFEDVWNATLDWQTFSSSFADPATRGSIPGPMPSIIGMDPPRHTAFRNLVSKGFTPRRIAQLEPEVRRIAKQHLDRVHGARNCEFQAALASRLPMDVISALVGIPEEDRDTFRTWIDKGLERDPDTRELPPGNRAYMVRAREFIRALLERRRREPRDDLISLLAESEYVDVDGVSKPLTDREIGSFVGLLATAGSETTTKLLGNCLVYLWQNPEQRRQLWEDASLLDSAIEEILRYDVPTQFQGRVCLRETRRHGVTIPEKARVMLVTAAACRDERVFEDPDRLDVRREIERPLHFGQGRHLCIGMSLARLEARVVLEEVRDRFPEYEVDEAGLTRTYQAHVRGFATVPIRW